MKHPALAALLVMVGCAGDPAVWSVEHEVPEAALLSVLASEHGMFVVGADDGRGPTVLRHRAETWERIETGDRGDLWWVVEDADGSIVMGGEGGRILTYDPVLERLDTHQTPRDSTVFGIWAAPDGTAFAVGGDVTAETQRGELWMRAGDEWVRDERVPADWLDDVVLFKVWGTSADDVWAVGERGTVLHSDGSSWQQVSVPTTTRLLTIHGNAEDGPIMVGGAANGVLLQPEGASFSDRMPPFMPGANGVFIEEDGRAWVVGNRGTVLSRERGGEWIVEPTSPTSLDLHAITVDAEGVAWAVGGALLSPSLDRGIVIRLGP